MAQLLIDYLRQLEGKGQTHVRLDEQAKTILRGFFQARRRAAARPAPSSPAPAPVAAAPAGPLVATGATAEEQLASLRDQAAQWAPAINLGTLRETMVFATGKANADLMLIGEAPGYEEERQKEPFKGKSGEKLNQILKAMGLSREEVYLSSLCKFRPAMPGQTTTNRKPTLPEMEACLPLLLAEVKIVKPKCIVALGATAAQGLLGTTASVDKLRGAWHEFEGVPLLVTIHPSFLLHNDSANDEKRKVWEDMLTIMDCLKMPISDKQRGFFR